jgi:hypothetical protein
MEKLRGEEDQWKGRHWAFVSGKEPGEGWWHKMNKSRNMCKCTHLKVGQLFFYFPNQIIVGSQLVFFYIFSATLFAKHFVFEKNL